MPTTMCKKDVRALLIETWLASTNKLLFSTCNCVSMAQPYLYALAGASVVDFALNSGNFQLSDIAQMPGPLGAVIGYAGGAMIINAVVDRGGNDSSLLNYLPLATAAAVPWYFGADPTLALGMTAGIYVAVNFL
jgi:hypothetical protein